MKTLCASALLGISLIGCGDDAPPDGLPAMIAGPYETELALGADTRTAVPAGLEALPRDAVARFYWYAPEARGATIAFELVAENTMIEQGAVVHRVENAVGEEQVQGTIAIDPRHTSAGGVRRTAAGVEWLEGTYRLRASVAGQEVASHLFEIR
jgi:hypothetical protein